MQNKLYSEALQIKALYKSGIISREEAMDRIRPYADAYNEASERIAKKYNRKPYKFSFIAFMR